MITLNLLERRTDRRVPWMERAVFQCGPEDTGLAIWQDVSLNGARVCTGRYVEPGRLILLSLEPLCLSDEKELELKGRIMWCRPMETEDAFAAGVRIFHDDPETMHAFHELVQEAQTAHRTDCASVLAT